MNRDHVIEKINSYRKLLELTLKSVTKDEAVQKEVQSEFAQWVEGQLNSLMGKPSAGFSDQEVALLKAFAVKLLNKSETRAEPASNTVSQASSQLQSREQQPKPSNGITERDRESIARARPIKDREPSREADPLLRQLEEMDRRSPQY